ncbi:hypothetical protein BC832DRAFT_567581 [Gaertneriomyces semiglobifer]|nr:hypothetical protein BC832DRAFT_567581 [Gaertneriomyces semiglobifer]
MDRAKSPRMCRWQNVTRDLQGFLDSAQSGLEDIDVDLPLLEWCPVFILGVFLVLALMEYKLVWWYATQPRLGKCCVTRR